MKKNVIERFLINQFEIEDILELHNDYCKHFGYSNNVYYPMCEIDTMFNTPSELIASIRNGAKLGYMFDANEKYFHYIEDEDAVSVDFDVICYDVLAEHLINFGDSNYQFSKQLEEHLEEKLIEYIYSLLTERYTKKEIANKVKTESFDVLMDDWDDFITEYFSDVVGVCPCCNHIIYKNYEHEYVYDNAKMKYTCGHCGEQTIF